MRAAISAADRLGVNAERLEELFSRAHHDVETGRLPSCQLAVARHGELVASATFGAADVARYTTYSVTKAVVAGAVWLLFGSGELTPGTRVVDMIPEFATNGKEVVAVEHLMTHTAGFPNAPMRPEDGADRQRRLERFASWRLDWPPGSRTVYHASSASWVLAELIERISGVDYRAFVNTRVLDALGLTETRLGTSADDVLEVEMVGAGSGADVNPEFVGDILLRYNEPVVRETGVPGAGLVSRAADVAMYFQALLHNPGGLWEAAVLADATGNPRNMQPDAMTGVPACRTLGLVIAGDDGNAVLRQFGDGVGPRTFGATGVGGQVGWADPDTGLSFGYLTNGLAADIVSAFKRTAALSTRVAKLVDS